MEPMVTKETEKAYRDFSERLLEACEDSKILPKKDERGFNKALGKLAGVGYKGAEKWVKGGGMPGMANASILAKKLGVRIEWLLTGEGPKKIDQDIPAFSRRHAMEQPASYAIDADDLLARKIQQLPEDLKNQIKALIEAIQKNINP
jgi:hypothetical protein